MLTGREAKSYLDGVVEAIDEGRVPRRPRFLSWLRAMALPAAVGLSLGLAGCLGTDGPGPQGIVDDGKADRWGDAAGSCLTPPELCGDGEDNDGDGWVDCRDHDCMGGTADACAGVVLYAAPSEQDCENGLDDDRDGNVDCEDGDCRGHCACQPLPPPAPWTESDCDGDLDGLTDCDDPGCASDPACQPSGPAVEICGNCVDDDGDGFDDSADPFCSEILGCSDMLDNDCDGAVDCDDADCMSDPGCAPGDPF